MRLIRRYFAVFASLLLLTTLCQAQFGGLLGGGKKDNNKSAVSRSDKAPEYSDKDKAKLAEIAQRPEVQAEVEKAWNDTRAKDLHQAYMINITGRPAFQEICDFQEQEENSPFFKACVYTNPMLQRYLNAIGQSLVPQNSPNLYAFRIVRDPLPKAWSLSTGSVYITTGFISLLDNEAQLSYVLAHEIAHIEKRHEYNKVRNAILEDKLNDDKEASAERKKALFSLATTVGGGLIGGLSGGGVGTGALLGFAGGMVGNRFLFNAKLTGTNWDIVEENEADDQAIKYMLDRGYDVREAPRLYAHLDRVVTKDSRVGLGFIGNARRVKERVGRCNQLINENYKNDIDAKLRASGLNSNSPEFSIVMSAVKRDNAIMALDQDLFELAQDNLEDAIALRSSDPLVHYYLGKVMALTAHTPADKQAALKHVADAIRLDAKRGALPDAHLENAMTLISQNNPSLKDSVVQELKAYLALYQRANAGNLPNNAAYIYDYFSLVGEDGWYLPPQWYTQTQLKANATIISPERVIRDAGEEGSTEGAVRAVSTHR